MLDINEAQTIIAYFSPTGNCKNIGNHIGKKLSNSSTKIAYFDFTTLKSRNTQLNLKENQLLIIIMPVYASRLPNKIAPFIADNIKGNGPAIIFSSYGNRDFGDSLSELATLLRNNGFYIIGGGTIPSEHAFAHQLATNRPNSDELNSIATYVEELNNKLNEENQNSMEWSKNKDTNILIPGNFPPGPYYKPLKEDKTPAVFLKAKPVTNKELCDQCKACANICPMGAIEYDDCSVVSGICIKCQACIKICHTKAKFFDNEDFLSHKKMLEENYSSNSPKLLLL